MNRPAGLAICSTIWDELLRHVDACLPEEACGFLGGADAMVRLVLPVENADHSRTRFRMDPRAQLEGMARLDEPGVSMLGIYHSHPGGPAGLSATDLAEAAYPEAALVVVSPTAGGWTAHAFLLEGADPREIPFRIVEGHGDA